MRTQQSCGEAAAGRLARSTPGSGNSVAARRGRTPVRWPAARGRGSPGRAGDRPGREEAGFKDRRFRSPAPRRRRRRLARGARASPPPPPRSRRRLREQKIRLCFRQSGPGQGKFQTQGLGRLSPSQRERPLGLRAPGDLPGSLGRALRPPRGDVSRILGLSPWNVDVAFVPRRAAEPAVPGVSVGPDGFLGGPWAGRSPRQAPRVAVTRQGAWPGTCVRGRGRAPACGRLIKARPASPCVRHQGSHDRWAPCFHLVLAELPTPQIRCHT